jgi:Annexin
MLLSLIAFVSSLRLVIGTNEDLLNVTLLRFAPIMSDIKLEYVDLYGKTIADSIRQETRGDSEKLLLYMIGEME